MNDDEKIEAGDNMAQDNDMAASARELDRLADYIISNVPGEPSEDGGVVDTAIRLIARAVSNGTHSDCCVACRDELFVVRAMMTEMHGVFMPLMQAIMQNPMFTAMMPQDVEVPDGGVAALLSTR